MFTQHFTSSSFNQHGIFLLDGLGALLSTIFLLCLLAPFYPYFGIPQHIIINLGIGAASLALYALICFILKVKNRAYFLVVSILGNLVYAVMSGTCISLYMNSLTLWGGLYFGIEIILLFFVMLLEIKVVTGIAVGRY